MSLRLHIGAGSSWEKKNSPSSRPRIPGGCGQGKSGKDAAGNDGTKKGKCHYCGKKGH